MKPVKKDRSFHVNYGPVVIWLEDLEAILALATDAQELELSTEEYKFSSLDELKEHFGKQPIHGFKISSSKPSFDVSFHPFGTSLFVMSSPTSLQLYHELNDILRKRQRRPRWAYTSWIGLLSLSPIFLSWAWHPDNQLLSLVPPALSLIGLFWFFWAAFISMKKHAVIYAQRSHDAPSFLRRNRDAILLIIVSGVIGGVITLGFAKLRDYVTPPPIAIEQQKP